MNQRAATFVGDIPANYDAGLGPHIFEDYAADIARRAAARAPGDVLELAAGTGIVSCKLHDSLPHASNLTVTDLNEPMLEIARRKLAGAADIRAMVADAMDLPFADKSFDLIVCQFGVMFFPDKSASFRTALRVLRPGGSYLFNVWGPMAKNPFAEIAFNTTAKFFPKDPPGFYRVPFGYNDIAEITRDLSGAGFKHVGYDVLRLTKRIEDYPLFARGIVYGNPVIAEINERATSSAEEIHNAVIDALTARLGPAPAYMPLEAIVFEAQRP